MHAHLKFDDGEIVGKSPEGLWAVELLHFNDEASVTLRHTLAQSIDALRLQAIGARQDLRKVRRRIGKKAPGPQDLAAIGTFDGIFKGRSGARRVERDSRLIASHLVRGR